MDDLDVRSALTEYVTEGEPPIGLTGEDVLAAGRRSRRRRLSAGVAGAAFTVVAILGVTFAVTAPQPPPPPPLQPAEPVAGDHCETRRPGETEEQVITRLSCVVGTAVRSRVASGARIENLPPLGASPPSDPFRLTAKRNEENGEVGTTYYVNVRVSDGRGAGSIHISVVPPIYHLMTSCDDLTVPKTASCSTHRLPGGPLRETADRNAEGLIVLTARISRPAGIIEVTAENTGVVATGDGVYRPAQRAEPPLTPVQLQEIVADPGLVP
ncbi:hypothetical protein [Amycolatopsis alba]|uniref:Uncharacterized protein n=1 Tax=Amycolatopsis alba DSM 44262 TaxID=1125972 RepID=A0A229RZK9_AMYAL|nr:hypothetical protein [Amycolatopsis alba]OXM52076.1 hypothetical protein CFP75_11510 [Amycolatopsis alba DSM 44262]